MRLTAGSVACFPQGSRPPTSYSALPTQVGAPPPTSDSALPPQVGAHPTTFDSATVQVVHPQPLTALQPTPPTHCSDSALPTQVGTPPTPVTDASVAPSEEESSCETNHEASGGPSLQRGGPSSNTSVAKQTVGHEEDNFDQGKQLNKNICYAFLKGKGGIGKGKWG